MDPSRKMMLDANAAPSARKEADASVRELSLLVSPAKTACESVRPADRRPILFTKSMKRMGRCVRALRAGRQRSADPEVIGRGKRGLRAGRAGFVYDDGAGASEPGNLDRHKGVGPDHNASLRSPRHGCAAEGDAGGVQESLADEANVSSGAAVASGDGVDKWRHPGVVFKEFSAVVVDPDWDPEVAPLVLNPPL